MKKSVNLRNWKVNLNSCFWLIKYIFSFLGEEIDEVAKMEEGNKQIKNEIEEMKRKYQLMMDYAKQNNMEIVSWVLIGPIKNIDLLSTNHNEVFW